MALTKISMISKLCEDMKLTKKQASDSIEAIIEVMKSALTSGDDVLVSGFGKFCLNEKNKRRGRNPATGEEMMLDARKTVTFKSSGILRDKINGE
jgi:integration host factor subunit alpha